MRKVDRYLGPIAVPSDWILKGLSVLGQALLELYVSERRKGNSKPSRWNVVFWYGYGLKSWEVCSSWEKEGEDED